MRVLKMREAQIKIATPAKAWQMSGSLKKYQVLNQNP